VSEYIALRILNLDIRRRRLASFTL